MESLQKSLKTSDALLGTAMQDYATFPTISLNLLKALEDRFPQKDFTTDYAVRDIDYYCGARSVIQFLKQIHEDQNENILQ